MLTRATSGASLNSGTGGSLPAPTSDALVKLVEDFFDFLSACVEDRLPSDPTCAAAVKGLAAADLEPTSVVSCLENAIESRWLAAVSLGVCLTAKAINVFFIWWDAIHPPELQPSGLALTPLHPRVGGAPA